MIGKLLKALRNNRGDVFTLDFIQSKTGVPKGHLSRIENNKVSPTQDMLFKILIHGFDMKPSKAKNLIAQWRIKEALEGADDPAKVIGDVIGDNNIVINGEGNTVIKK